MEETKQKRKPKRVLKNIDFEKGENTHLALVHRDQGGPANGADYKLVIKATQFSDEFFEKASQVTVQLDIVEYLTRFYGLMQTDAEVLARSLGYTTPGMEKAALEAQEEMLEDKEPPEYPSWEDEPGDKKYERYVESRVASIEVMKKLYEAENINDVLSNLDEDDYLQLLVDQSKIEKVFKKIDSENNKDVTKSKVKTKTVTTKESTEVAKAMEGDTSTTNACVESEVGVATPVVKQLNKEKKSMTDEVHIVEREVELVEKAQFESIQKQLEENKIQLQKALDLVKKFETEKKEAIAKARKEQITKACGKHAEVIFKAVGECEEETFVEVVKALAEMQELVEKSALFQEQGASVSDVEKIEEDALIKMMKSKYKQQ